MCVCGGSSRGLYRCTGISCDSRASIAGIGAGTGISRWRAAVLAGGPRHAPLVPLGSSRWCSGNRGTCHRHHRDAGNRGTCRRHAGNRGTCHRHAGNIGGRVTGMRPPLFSDGQRPLFPHCFLRRDTARRESRFRSAGRVSEAVRHRPAGVRSPCRDSDMTRICPLYTRAAGHEGTSAPLGYVPSREWADMPSEHI